VVRTDYQSVAEYEVNIGEQDPRGELAPSPPLMALVSRALSNWRSVVSTERRSGRMFPVSSSERSYVYDYEYHDTWSCGQSRHLTLIVQTRQSIEDGKASIVTET